MSKVGKVQAGQGLASKEQKAFRELLAAYEERAYKRGLKTADTILKKSPEHGETVCMKGIILYNMGRKEEGRELVKKGVRLNMASHICWHVNALLHRSEKDYSQALACYSQAVRIDPDQVGMVRDLVTVQLQLRKFADTLPHRLHLLALQPKLRTSWLGLAVSHHVNKQYDKALDVLIRYEGMQVQIPKHDFDYSELVLYHALVFEDAGREEEAIEYLDNQSAKVIDRLSFSSARARLLLKADRLKSAELAYRALLEDNPDNYEFIKQYVRARGASLEDGHSNEKALEILDDLFASLPKSSAVRRLTLRVASGDVLKRRLTTYITEYLIKGVPSLFADIKPLYSDPEKSAILTTLLAELHDNLTSTGTLDGNPSEEGATKEYDTPTALVWLLYYLAQQSSLLGDHSAALRHLETAITHTPTLPELHMIKARVLKRAGDAVAAENAMDDARALDGQDRFLNGKAAKYLLRVDKVDQAHKVAGLFTRKDAATPIADLTDMQCLWFLLEEGESWKRQGNVAMALKRFHQINKIFADYRDDEYDFHTWCLRKVTVRAYTQLLQFEDQLYAHPSYFKAVKSAVEIYIKMADKPKSNGSAEDDALAEEERRKAAKKAKKADAKAKANAAVTPAKGSTANKEEESTAVVDEDPKGEKLAATEQPLEDAMKLLLPLQQLNSPNVEIWTMTFDVAYRQKLYLKALQALRTAHAIDPSHPALYPRLAQFHKAATAEPSSLSVEALAVYKAVSEKLFPWSSVEAANADVLQRHGESPRHVLAVAQASEPQQQSELVFTLLRQEKKDLAVAREAVELLKAASSDKLEEFQKQAAEAFPLARGFTAEQKHTNGKADEVEVLDP